MEQGKQASHYNRHLATNTSITAAEQGWRWARTHTSSKPLSRAMRFRMHCIGNFKREWAEKKGNKWPSLAFLPAEESRATASVYILEERVSSSEDVLWFYFIFFFRSPAETRSSPLFPPSFFTTDMSMTSLPQRRSARVIRSTVSQWLMEILIHWPDTASLLLFSLCAPGDIFYLLVSTHRFIPRAAPHTLMCVISIHRHTHTHRQKKTLCIIPSFFF